MSPTSRIKVDICKFDKLRSHFGVLCSHGRVPLVNDAIADSSCDHLVALLQLLADLVHELLDSQRIGVLILLVVVRVFALSVHYTPKLTIAASCATCCMWCTRYT